MSSALLPVAAHPGTSLNYAADVGYVGVATLVHPRASDSLDPIYLRYGVLLV